MDNSIHFSLQLTSQIFFYTCWNAENILPEECLPGLKITEQCSISLFLGLTEGLGN